MPQPVAIDQTLAEITSIILERCQPERLILFGSRARGDHQPDSDYDLLVIVDADADAIADSLPVRGDVDVLIDTPAEYERRRVDVGTMEFVIAREGRIIYEAPGFASRRAGRVAEATSESDAGDSLAAWLERARGDFRSMELVAGAVHEAACFHAHQAAEKFLKASLVHGRTPPPRTHTLVDLLRLCDPALRDDVELQSACEVLDRVYRKARYPNRPLPTPIESEHSVRAARVVRFAVERLIDR